MEGGSRRPGGFPVVPTVFTWGDLNDRLEDTQRRLSEVAGVPVTIGITVIEVTSV